MTIFCRRWATRSIRFWAVTDQLIPSYVRQLSCYRDLKSAVQNGESVIDRYRFLHANGSLV